MHALESEIDLPEDVPGIVAQNPCLVARGRESGGESVEVFGSLLPAGKHLANSVSGRIAARKKRPPRGGLSRKRYVGAVEADAPLGQAFEMGGGPRGKPIGAERVR